MTRRLSEWRVLFSGLADAVFASLSTFTISLYTARTFSPAELGTFSLFFTGFLLAAVIPTNLVLVPAEIVTLSGAPEGRPKMICHGMKSGSPIAVVAVTIASVVAWLSARVPMDFALGLALTAAVCGVVSPLQDHMRRLYHLGERSHYAAALSVIQFLTIVAALFAFHVAALPISWRPLGALAIANCVSLGAGLAATAFRVGGETFARPSVPSLVRSGRWLVILEASSSGALFLSSAVIGWLAGADALGNAEAARIVAMPVFVLATGLGQALGPRCLAAGSNSDSEEAHRVARTFSTLLLLLGGTYAVLTIEPWWGNPIGEFVPHAYDVAGLVPATVGAFLLLGLPYPARAEIMGARRERLMPRAAVPAGIFQVIAALSALWIGPQARPLGVAVFGGVVLIGFLRLRRPIYQQGLSRPVSGKTRLEFSGSTPDISSSSDC